MKPSNIVEPLNPLTACGQYLALPVDRERPNIGLDLCRLLQLALANHNRAFF